MSGRRVPWWIWVLVFAPWVAGLTWAVTLMITDQADREFVLQVPVTVAAILGGTVATVLLAATVIGARFVRAGGDEQVRRSAEPEPDAGLQRLQRQLDDELAARLEALRGHIHAVRAAAERGILAAPEMAALRAAGAEIDDLATRVVEVRALAEIVGNRVDPEQIDIGKMLHEVVSTIRESPGLGGRHLSGPNVTARRPVVGDRDLMLLAMSKIVSNAITFSRPGDSLTIRAYDGPSADVVVEVSDTGLGLVSSSGGASAQVPDPGLGLALARVAVERQGGTFRVRTREGLGTVVTTVLPGSHLCAGAGSVALMRLLFAGTPDAALPSLEALIASHHDVVAVLTRPDARTGRGRRPAASPVASRALDAGIEVLRPRRPSDDEFRARLVELAPDCAPVVAYGALLPASVLDIPLHGWVNLHFSVLPAWRGAAPVQAAVRAGDEMTGATTFTIVEELDAGPVLGVLTELIRPRDTSGELLDRLAVAGAELLVQTLDGLEAGLVAGRPQPADGISFAPKVRVDDVRVDWANPAMHVDRLVRSATPDPGAWTEVRGARLGLGPVVPRPDHPDLKAGELAVSRSQVVVGTATHPVELGTVRPAGKRDMPAADWARGARVDGEVLGA